MITPPCDSPGCKQPSVHRVAPESAFIRNGNSQTWQRRPVSWVLHFCVFHYERKVWGKA